MITVTKRKFFDDTPVYRAIQLTEEAVVDMKSYVPDSVKELLVPGIWAVTSNSSEDITLYSEDDFWEVFEPFRTPILRLHQIPRDPWC